MIQNRNNFPPNHAIIGTGYRLLQDDDILKEEDETGWISTLLSIEHYERWTRFYPNFPKWQSYLGRTIKWICEETGDLKGHERIFRRKIDEPRIVTIDDIAKALGKKTTFLTGDISCCVRLVIPLQDNQLLLLQEGDTDDHHQVVVKPSSWKDQ